LKTKKIVTDSTVLQTGIVHPQNSTDSIDAIVLQFKNSNIVLLHWKNLRAEIGEYKILPPGGVLVGSAAFILETSNFDDLAKIKDFEIVVTDFSKNETAHELRFDRSLIDQAKYQVDSRRFVIDEPAGPVYSN
jgi:hypothetical protein